MRVIYADNNATPRVAPEVYDAMTPVLTGDYFESSSTYEPARHTAAAIIQARSQTAERLEVTEKGEADRILKVKAAEGDAQSKALQGRGIADQRQAIVAGLRDSVDEFQRSVPGTTAKDVMNLVLMTQYFDTLKEIGASSRSNTILIPHSPGSLGSLSEQIRNVMIEANQAVEGSRIRPEAFVGVGKGNGNGE